MLICIENRFRELECLLLRQAIPLATLCSFAHLCILPTIMAWEHWCSLFISQWELSTRLKLYVCMCACIVHMWHECLFSQTLASTPWPGEVGVILQDSQSEVSALDLCQGFEASALSAKGCFLQHQINNFETRCPTHHQAFFVTG